MADLQKLILHDSGNTGPGVVISEGYVDMTTDPRYDSGTHSVTSEGDGDFNDWDDETEFRDLREVKLAWLASLVERRLALGFLNSGERLPYNGLQYEANLDRLNSDGGEGEVGVIVIGWTWQAVLNANRVAVRDAYIAAQRAVAESEALYSVGIMMQTTVAALNSYDMIIRINFADVL